MRAIEGSATMGASVPSKSKASRGDDARVCARAACPSDRPAALAAAASLALAACEKTVQIVYELELRPPEKQHAPWLERVRGQAEAAFDALEAELACTPWPRQAQRLTQAGVSAAVAWSFAQRMLPGQLSTARCPHLADFTDWAETLDVFTRAPMD